MSMGDIITNLFHAQDIRFLSSGYYYTPFSFYIMAVSLLNLLGIPTIRGYFSKDLVLETCNFSYISFFIVFVIFLKEMQVLLMRLCLHLDTHLLLTEI